MTLIPQLLMSVSEATKLLQNQIKRGETAQSGDIFTPEGIQKILCQIDEWEAQTNELLLSMFDSPELAEEFLRAAAEYKKGDSLASNLSYISGRVTYKNYRLTDIKDRLSLYANESNEKSNSEESVEEYINVVDRICLRFHTIVRQLRERHNDRATLDVKDEYDVQDLLHTLLRLYFDDIRQEEYSPSYAGAGSRIDFLIKQEEFVVEVKKARDSLKAKQLGEQLIIDISRYKEHPSCKFLYCFVYDPDGYISNPQGIENDLSQIHDGLNVKVFIAPKSH